jgi:hypothetical protein
MEKILEEKNSGIGQPFIKKMGGQLEAYSGSP